MRFEEVYAGWQGKRLTQQEAGDLLGVSDQSVFAIRQCYCAEGAATATAR